MKRLLAPVLCAAALGLQSGSATAWSQWYYQNLPYAPAPGFWLYQNIPYGQGPVLPWLWYNQSGPLVPTTDFWSFGSMVSGLFVEQSQSPAGYSILVHTGEAGIQGVDVSVQGNSVLIRSGGGVSGPGTQQSGWATQWVSLPADANLGALRTTPRNDRLLEIFVPRR